MELVEEEALVLGLKSKLEEEDLNLEQKVSLLNDGLNSETTPTTLVCLKPVSTLHREPHCFITCLFFIKSKKPVCYMVTHWFFTSNQCVTMTKE